MHSKGSDANIIRSKQPSKFHHKNQSLRESGKHTKQHDGTRRALARIDRDGEKES